MYANRAPVPAELRRLNRWVRWDLVERRGRVDKVPLTLAGRHASSADPATWTDYSSARASCVGVGLGFVLNGDGVSCIDLDDCMVSGKPNAQAQALMDRFPAAWVELSPSGSGLHLWGAAPAGPGQRTTVDGLSVEFYSTGRYLTITGRTLRAGNLSTDITAVLHAQLLRR